MPTTHISAAQLANTVASTQRSKNPFATWMHNDPALYAPVYNSGIISRLYSWGPVEFLVQPLNIHEVDHDTESDWAHKEIAGGAIYREWVGENDETLYMRGRIFPYRIGGMIQLETFETLRRDGIANLLIRGDGAKLGWFVCEKLVRAHTFLSAEGVGSQIAFESVFARVPVPSNETYISSLWGSVSKPK